MHADEKTISTLRGVILVEFKDKLGADKGDGYLPLVGDGYLALVGDGYLLYIANEASFFIFSIVIMMFELIYGRCENKK